jgi:hypothetical protein
MRDYFIIVDFIFLSNVKMQDFNPTHAFKKIFFSLVLLFILCAWMICLNIYTCAMSVSGGCGGQKKASDLLKLELQDRSLPVSGLQTTLACQFPL